MGTLTSRPSEHRVRALDGVRALAVAGVLAYHLGDRWASGGYLGVDLFFVLSGYLITGLLLEEWARSGRIDLGAFWGRRARRLLPALLLLLVAVCGFVVAMGRWGPPGWIAQVDLSGLRADALATLAYVANWHAIWAHQSYFAQFAAPSPLAHTWSLAIEEQFYLVWPPLLLGLLGLCRRAGRAARWRAPLAVVVVAGALSSALLMALLYRQGVDPSRVYYGTDTRSADLLVGASVAVWTAARPQPGPRRRLALHIAAPAAVALLGWCWVVGGTGGGVPQPWMFRGGFLVCAALAAVVIADVRLARGPLAAALSISPLAWLGRISYGIYLWHWPVFVYLTPAATGLGSAPLDIARIAVTVAIATASYYLVELPIRRRSFVGWRRWALAPAGSLATAAVVVVAGFPAIAVGSGAAAAASGTVPTAASVWTGTGAVPGSGGVVGAPLDRLPAHGVLRVTVLGDSVARAAEPALAAALDATGAARVSNATIDGFGLTTDRIWRTSLPAIVAADRTQIVVATWSWDDICGPSSPTQMAQRYGPVVCALEHPVAYERLLASAVRLLLAHGVAAVVFLQFPTTGSVSGGTDMGQRARDAGERAWDRAARALAAVFPGRVAYLPVAGAVLRDGRFSSWLPPVTDPSAPLGTWVRVRTMDEVHLCPAGAARYAAAALADLEPLLGLRPARAAWAVGRWSSSAVYDTPPGSCPPDHPAG